LTDQVVLNAYHSIGQLASQGGPYAAIFDGSEVRDVKLSADTVRSLARTQFSSPELRSYALARAMIYEETQSVPATDTMWRI